MGRKKGRKKEGRKGDSGRVATWAAYLKLSGYWSTFNLWVIYWSTVSRVGWVASAFQDLATLDEGRGGRGRRRIGGAICPK